MKAFSRVSLSFLPLFQFELMKILIFNDDDYDDEYDVSTSHRYRYRHRHRYSHP